MTENPQIELAYNFVQYTNRNVFLTGKAGTGKTTFLRRLRHDALKRMVVVAPTGVAAINAGGVTIHSMFQLPFGPIVPGMALNESYNRRFSKEKINIIRSMELLVIDEISMVRADLLDGIDTVLRTYRNRTLPFGGVQLLMIGDLQQLAPVAKEDEWALLKTHYSTPFFFASKALQQTASVNIELKHIYRQSDPEFIDLLNRVRNRQMDAATVARLNQRYIPGFADQIHEGYIILTTHNHSAKAINERQLQNLSTRPHLFRAEVKGDFPEYNYPTDGELRLKLGAQVMFVKNDPSPEKRYYNGKIGILEKIIDDTLFVRCDNEEPIAVTQQKWSNIKYSIDAESQEITETETGTFTQYPLKTAWAITIHKSQGLTFDKAIIDAGASFAHGQVYVALSRCKTLEGMVLSSPISPASLHADTSVQSFTQQVEQNQPDQQQLVEARINYQHQLLFELFNLATLTNRLTYLHRQTGEHANALHGSLTTSIGTMLSEFRNNILPVADKFTNQIRQYTNIVPDITQNEPLQERIRKATSWFADKMTTSLEKPLKSTSVISDNKTIKKQVGEAFTRFAEELNIKMACFKASTHGFDIKTYLDAKGKAAIAPTEITASTARKSNDSDEAASLTIEHPKLYARLKTWRNHKAEELNAPVYVVLPTATMAEICNKLPLYMPELKNIKGLGKKKIADYGPAIMEMVMAYRKENNIETAEIIPMGIDEEKKEPKIPTHELSYQMLRQGMSINDIAQNRGMVPATIEGHLSRYVENGQLELTEIMEPSKIDTISEYLQNNRMTSLSDTKNALGETVSYGEIKLVQSYLKLQSEA